MKIKFFKDTSEDVRKDLAKFVEKHNVINIKVIGHYTSQFHDGSGFNSYDVPIKGSIMTRLEFMVMYEDKKK